MPQAVITVMSSGYLQLGHVTPFGVQTSIENFDSFADTQAFSARNRIRLKYTGRRECLLTSEQVVALSRVPSGRTLNECAAHLEWTTGKTWAFAQKMEGFGFIAISRAKKRGGNVLHLSSEGEKLLRSLKVSV